jgi:hypothetical protein
VKYHQMKYNLSIEQQGRLIDWAIKKSSTFSIVWATSFKFKKSAKRVEKQLKPFLEKTEFTNSWPGTTQSGPADTKIQFYKVTKKSAKVLKKVGSIFKWIAPEFPEDIAFYDKKHKPVLGSVAHEKMVILYRKPKIKQYSLVELTKEFKESIKNKKDHPIMREKTFVFFGEIPNMEGHCVVSGHKSGKVFSGYDLDSFQEIEEEGY